MEIPVNGVSSSPKPYEQMPSSPIGPGEPPKHDWAKFRKVLLTGFLVLLALVGIWEFIHCLGWLWFILLALLLGGGRIALAAYADHLVGQGRYDHALRLVPILAISGVGRNHLRADVLTSAGRYKEAALVLRDVIHHMRGKRVTRVTRIKICFDLENLGNLLLETGRFEEAQRFFQDAARLYPYRSVSPTGMAEVLLRQGIFPEVALANTEKALNLFQHGTERIICSSRLGGILATRAWALAACGRGAEAREAINAALNGPARKTKGPLAEVHFKAGMSMLALSQRLGAVEHFALGSQLDPVGRWGRLCTEALATA
ncbi:MAG: tetratricopeptide repeat protein [Terracidiphilus sp.]